MVTSQQGGETKRNVQAEGQSETLGKGEGEGRKVETKEPNDNFQMRRPLVRAETDDFPSTEPIQADLFGNVNEYKGIADQNVLLLVLVLTTLNRS